METTLIEFREEDFKHKISTLKFFGTLFTQLIDIFNSFGYGKVEKNDLPDLIFNTNAYVEKKARQNKDFSKLTELGLDPSKLTSMLKTPDRLDELFTKIEQINRIFKRDNPDNSYFIGGSIKDLLCRFDFENEIVLKKHYYDEYRKFFEVKVGSDEATNLYNFGNELIVLYNRYRLTNCFRSNSKDTFNLLFKFNEDEITLNTEHISGMEGLAQSRK